MGSDTRELIQCQGRSHSQQELHSLVAKTLQPGVAGLKGEARWIIVLVSKDDLGQV